MGKIQSRPKPPKAPSPKEGDLAFPDPIYIYSATDKQELTEEEVEHIRRVFESIRKQLDSFTIGAP